MNIEKKYIRRLLKKSLRGDFEKILGEAKMTAAEEQIIRSIYIEGKSKIETAMNNHVSESTVFRVTDDFCDRAIALLRKTNS